MLITSVQQSESVIIYIYIYIHTHTHTHTFFSIFFFVLVYHRILNIIPRTVLYSCLGNPEAPSRLQSIGSQKRRTQQQLNNNYRVGPCCLPILCMPVCICSPTLPVQLSPTPLPLGSYQSVLYVPDSASEILQALLCCILDSAYK